MLYAIFCYHDEDVVGAWSKADDDAVLAKRAVVTGELAAQGRLGPVARLMPTSAAVTIRSGGEPLVLDGPFAETKEQLGGFYLVEAPDKVAAAAMAAKIPAARFGCARLKGFPPKRPRRCLAFHVTR